MSEEFILSVIFFVDSFSLMLLSDCSSTTSLGFKELIISFAWLLAVTASFNFIGPLFVAYWLINSLYFTSCSALSDSKGMFNSLAREEVNRGFSPRAPLFKLSIALLLALDVLVKFST